MSSRTKGLRVLVCAFCSLTLAYLNSGCSGQAGSSSGSSSGSSLSLSGTLSLGGGGSGKVGAIPEDKIETMAVDLTAYKVVCATVSPPVKSGSASVKSDEAGYSRNPH